VTLLFSFFENEKYNAKEYKQLKGQTIETLTIIASSVGGKMFQPVAEKLIELMIHMQQSQFEQTDPQKTYILAGWQRLCLVYGKELATYLERILPSLFKLVENVINNELKVVNEPETKEEEKKELKDFKDENINTF
jgi:importin-5